MDASFVIGAAAVFLAGLVLLGLVALLREKKVGYVYLAYFAIFYIYVVKVLDYTLFQFQSLILLKHFMPNLILNGQTAGESMNLVPLLTLTPDAVTTSLLNILLFMPFGFGLPFIAAFRLRRVVIAGALFSIVIECLQWLTGFMAHITFRTADVNDVIFNTAGTAIGYILFIGFVRLCRRASRRSGMAANPLLRHIVERPQADTRR